MGRGPGQLQGRSPPVRVGEEVNGERPTSRHATVTGLHSLEVRGPHRRPWCRLGTGTGTEPVSLVSCPPGLPAHGTPPVSDSLPGPPHLRRRESLPRTRGGRGRITHTQEKGLLLVFTHLLFDFEGKGLCHEYFITFFFSNAFSRTLGNLSHNTSPVDRGRPGVNLLWSTLGEYMLSIRPSTKSENKIRGIPKV